MRGSPRRLLVIALALLAACAPLQLPATDTPLPVGSPASVASDTPSAAPTLADGSVADSSGTPGAGSPTPFPMCTPPPCWSDEAYYCPGQCPGGCGTTCATKTPAIGGADGLSGTQSVPPASPTPTFPAPGEMCALPQLSPGIGGNQPQAVFRCASTDSARVGEMVNILAEAVGLPTPVFIIEARDMQGFGSVRLQLMAENRLRGVESVSEVVKLVTAQASGTRAFVTLEALAPGSVEVAIGAGTAEGRFVSAEPLTLTVTP